MKIKPLVTGKSVDVSKELMIYLMNKPTAPILGLQLLYLEINCTIAIGYWERRRKEHCTSSEQLPSSFQLELTV
jgi:hypothetical protein